MYRVHLEGVLEVYAALRDSDGHPKISNESTTVTAFSRNGLTETAAK